MTGYYLTLGYNSGCSKNYEQKEIIKIFVKTYETICNNLMLIVREYNKITHYGISLSNEYVHAYKIRTDSTIKLIYDEEGNPEIMQLASGGKPGRKKKEELRRAFCRVFINEMHSRKIEVNLIVA